MTTQCSTRSHCYLSRALLSSPLLWLVTFSSFSWLERNPKIWDSLVLLSHGIRQSGRGDGNRWTPAGCNGKNKQATRRDGRAANCCTCDNMLLWRCLMILNVIYCAITIAISVAGRFCFPKILYNTFLGKWKVYIFLTLDVAVNGVPFISHPLKVASSLPSSICLIICECSKTLFCPDKPTNPDTKKWKPL